jgi:enamine deaminase RidA (YjgF/YER057c/UK114 family)
MKTAYSPAAAGTARPFGRSQDVIFISAQSAAPDQPATAIEQLEIAVAKVAAALALAGASLSDVVKLGLFYHNDLVAQEPAVLARLRELVPGTPAPVLTAIPLPCIPNGGLLQLEAIAIDPASPRSAARRTAPGRYGFSSAVRAADLVFVGAQMSVDEAGNTLHGGDIVAQAKATITNLARALEQVGADASCIAKLNTYYVGFGTTADWSMAARVRSDAFVKPGPGATGVPVPGPYPAGQLIRQEALGLVNEDGTAAARRTSWPKGVWDWPIPVSFEQGLELNGMIITGGQVACTVTGQALHPKDLGKQTLNVMGCIASILGGLGHTVDCLGKVTVFYATDGDPADIDTVMSRIEPFFANGLPALTLVPLKKLGIDDVEIEIEGVGAI